MTQGHKHRKIKVKRNGLIHKALTFPVYRTKNLAKVEPSPYPYGIIVAGRILEKTPDEVGPNEVYYLSTLSILHRWTGLVLNIGKQPTGDTNA